MHPHLRNYPISMPGSKRAVIEKLWPNLPKPPGTWGCFVVPFFGTGADSYYMHSQGYRVKGADLQTQLVSFHNNAVSDFGFCEFWVAHVYDRTKDQYLALRAEYNAAPRSWVYYLLSRLSFNKLIRHNRAGGFNAHVGSLRENPLPSRAAIQTHADFIAAIGGVLLADFRATCARAQRGDVVYLDPPYLGGFDAYLGPPFPHDDLFTQCQDLVDRRIAFACSNSLAAAERFPQECHVIELTRSGCVSSNTSNRGSVKEILAVYRP